MRLSIPRAVLLAVLLSGAVAALLLGRGDRVTCAPDRALTDSPDAGPRTPRLTGLPPSRDGETSGGIHGVVLLDGAPTPAQVLVRRSVGSTATHETVAYLQGPQPGGEVVASAPAGPDGTFEIGGLPPGPYVLDATAEGGARGRRRVVGLRAGERLNLGIPVRSGTGVLKGRVEFSDGRPWRGRVRVLVDDASGGPPYDEADPLVRWTGTDEEGRFQVGDLSGARVAVHAIEEGASCVAGPSARLPYRGEYVLVVPTEEKGVGGRVVSDETGEPLAGATVLAEDWTWDAPSVFRRVTADDGRFQMPLPAPRARVTVAAQGFSPRDNYVDRGGPELVVALVRSGHIHGSVRTEAGEPVAGIGVCVTWAATGQPVRWTKTDARGTYVVEGLVTGDFGVYARGLGWVSRGLEGVQNKGWNSHVVAVAPEQRVRRDLVVSRAARASGRVTTPEGCIVVGASVMATPKQPYGEGIGPVGAFLGSDHAVTQDDGSFLLSTLVPGVEYDFTASAKTAGAKGFTSATAWAGVAHAKDVLDVTLRLGPPADDAEDDDPPGDESLRVISGQVVHRDGTPAGGARVQCDCGDGNPACQEEPADGEGYFRFEDVHAGEHVLTADLASRTALRTASWTAQGTATAGEDDVRLTLVEVPVSPDREDEKRELVEVVVLDPAGSPVPRATIRLREPGSLRYQGWAQVTHGAATIDRGRLRRSYAVSIEGAGTAGGVPLPWGVAWGTIAEEESRVEMRLPPEAPILGRVLGQDGRPIPGVLLEAVAARLPAPEPHRRYEAVSARARTDASGSFRLGGLGPEAYRLRVEGPPDCAQADDVVAEGGVADLTITLRRGVSVTVTVLDADGQPVVGALVGASRDPHPIHWEWPDSIVTALNEGGVARTGALGSVVLSSLDPERTYDLYVGAPRHRLDLGGVDTPIWRPGDTIVRLPRKPLPPEDGAAGGR